MKTAIAAVLAIGLMCSVGKAAPIAAGGVQFPASTLSGPTDGAIIASIASPFSIPGSFSGTLYSQAVKGDTSNPLGGLTFIYQIASDGLSGKKSIGRMSISGYADFSTDVGYDPTSLVAPAMITRDPAGNVLGYNFIPLPFNAHTGFLTPGKSSARLIVQTDAKSYQDAIANFIDGGVTSASTLGPNVPEPSTVILSGVCGAALLMWRRWR